MKLFEFSFILSQSIDIKIDIKKAVLQNLQEKKRKITISNLKVVANSYWGLYKIVRTDSRVVNYDRVTKLVTHI